MTLPQGSEAGTSARTLALALFGAGVDAVAGNVCTRRELERLAAEPAGLGDRVRLVAIGKAADAMTRGAIEILGERLVGGLVVTKHGHLTEPVRRHPRLRCVESSHPVPDDSSLAAGRATLAEVAAAGPDEHLLVLVSGGGSALVEALVDGIDLDELRRRTDALLAGGAPIGEINRERRSLSRIKGGGLLGAARAGRLTQLLISDVPGDRVGDIASGPLVAPDDADPDGPAVDTRLVATNRIARQAVVAAARAGGLTAIDAGALLDGDILQVPTRLTAALADASGADVLVAGGEPTVVLPPDPGRGGRNQQLAAMLAGALAAQEGGESGGPGAPVTWLACGTDGTDGPTDAAGGVVDASTRRRAAAHGFDLERALARADAGPWLEASGALVRTGPTGTNVMDLAIAVRTRP